MERIVKEKMAEKKERSLAGYEEMKISNLEIDSIANRIMALSIEDIDRLWFNTGWIEGEAEKDGRKALPNWRLEKIKKDKEFAIERFWDLISDDPTLLLRVCSEFIENLNKLDGKRL